MAFMSNRNMTLGDKLVEKGQIIPQSIIDAIPPLRYNSLLRVKHIIEIPDEDIGEICEVCGEGPFVRIARHMTAKHDDTVNELVVDLRETVGLEEAVNALSTISTETSGEQE